MACFAVPNPAFVFYEAISRTSTGMEFPGWSDISKKHEENGNDYIPHKIKTLSKTGRCPVNSKVTIFREIVFL